MGLHAHTSVSVRVLTGIVAIPPDLPKQVARASEECAIFMFAHLPAERRL